MTTASKGKLPTDSVHKIANSEALRYLRIHFHVMSHCSRCVGGIPFVHFAKFEAVNLLFYNVINVPNKKDEDVHCCQLNGNFFEEIFSQVTPQSFLFIFYVKFVIFRTLKLGLTVSEPQSESEQTCWCWINLPWIMNYWILYPLAKLTSDKLITVTNFFNLNNSDS